MTHDERISSYIDNELSPEMEQEFLISLAASDTLRRSFRSELVLKKVLHRDETLTTPPREMRAAIFATVGLGAVALSASKANAAPVQAGQSSATSASAPIASHGFLKTLFATKFNALLTAAGLSLSALAGYGVHSVTSQDAQQTVQTVQSNVPSQQQAMPFNQMPSVTPAATQDVATTQNRSTAQDVPTTTTHVVQKHPAHRAIKSTASTIAVQHDTTPVSGISGGSTIGINAPKIGNTK